MQKGENNLFRKIFAVITGITVWYLLNIVTQVLLLSRDVDIGIIILRYNLLFVYTIVMGFVSAIISQKKKFVIAIITVLLAYIPLTVIMLCLPDNLPAIPSRPSAQSILFIALILIAMGMIGAGLAHFVSKRRENDGNS